MSDRGDGSRGHIVRLSVWLATILVGMSSLVAAQDKSETPPKVDLFIGYQWLNPGGQVPEAGQPPASPVSVTPPGMGKGVGSAVAYNFSSHFAFEADFGHNWNDFGYETTVSAGPRLMFRTGEMNYFLHTLLGSESLRHQHRDRGGKRLDYRQWPGSHSRGRNRSAGGAAPDHPAV